MTEYPDCLSVSSLNTRIRNLLENKISDIWVRGEISNFHHHPSSGHMYFTLKDGSSELRCTMFRMNNLHLKFFPNDGMEVRLFGLVTIYEKRGQVQLKVSMMQPEGLGDLFKSFEALKISLEKEGLFDSEHKKEIPQFPKRIGILTSGTSAAYRDILNVLDRRAPHVELLLYSVKVQGEGSAGELVNGIELFNKECSADVIIIGRGGGSIEDLWTFNEESVARAIFNSKIPIISAVGHETDYTISDFVADLRAPTPSAAAELAGPLREDLILGLNNDKVRLIRSIQNQLEQRWLYLDQCEKRISLQSPTRKIEMQIDALRKMHQRLLLAFQKKHSFFYERIKHLGKQLSSLGPNEVIGRGYAIPIDQGGKVIRSSDQISLGESFQLKMANGGMVAKKTSDINDT